MKNSILINTKLNAPTVDQYINQFLELLSSSSANEIEGILYFWKTEKPIPRAIGSNNILYIGKTIKSLSSRYRQKKCLDLERQYFENVYKHLIEEYGPMQIQIQPSENPSDDEWHAVNKYYNAHKEFPPPPKPHVTKKTQGNFLINDAKNAALAHL